MIHRLALLMGGTGAAGVLALALALGGFGAPLPNTPDAFVPVANDALGGGQLAADAPTDQPTINTSLGGGEPQNTTKKVIDTVYVLPAPAVVHTGKPASDANQPADDNNGGNQAGDEQNGDDQGDDSSADDENEGSDEDAEDGNDDDQAGGEDDNDDGDHSDDGGSDDGGQEPGDD